MLRYHQGRTSFTTLSVNSQSVSRVAYDLCVRRIPWETVDTQFTSIRIVVDDTLLQIQHQSLDQFGICITSTDFPKFQNFISSTLLWCCKSHNPLFPKQPATTRSSYMSFRHTLSIQTIITVLRTTFPYQITHSIIHVAMIALFSIIIR